MRRTLIISMGIGALAIGISAQAQEHMSHDHSMPATAAETIDARELVTFPPAMRQHTLANMRDHLMALSEILSAMSLGRYVEAARVANARLGLDSPSAEGCKSESAQAPQMPKAAGMDHQMAEFMPEPMRKVGFAMHQSASAFASEALKASKTGNPKPALTALSQVTQQCTACHVAYRVQ